jgi:hypothetical protein
VRKKNKELGFCGVELGALLISCFNFATGLLLGFSYSSYSRATIESGSPTKYRENELRIMDRREEAKGTYW